MRNILFPVMGLFLLLWMAPLAAEDDIVYENRYVELSPDLVSNLQGRKSYIRTRVQLLTNRADIAYYIEENLPLIRHELLMTLIDKKASDIKTPSGKAALQKEMLKNASAALDEKVPVKGLLTGIFFESYHVK